MVAYQIKIHGDIRGTAFRSAAMHAAQRFRIKGFIRYEDEHSLRMEAQGEAGDVNQFVHFCREWYPANNIRDFIVSEKEPENYTGFALLRDINEEENLREISPWFQKIKHIMRL